MGGRQQSLIACCAGLMNAIDRAYRAKFTPELQQRQGLDATKNPGETKRRKIKLAELIAHQEVSLPNKKSVR
jgi:hypothetical protein